MLQCKPKSWFPQHAPPKKKEIYNAVKLYFKNFVKVGKYQMALCKICTVKFGNYWHDMTTLRERSNFPICSSGTYKSH